MAKIQAAFPQSIPQGPCTITLLIKPHRKKPPLPDVRDVAASPRLYLTLAALPLDIPALGPQEDPTALHTPPKLALSRWYFYVHGPFPSYKQIVTRIPMQGTLSNANSTHPALSCCPLCSRSSGFCWNPDTKCSQGCGCTQLPSLEDSFAARAAHETCHPAS